MLFSDIAYAAARACRKLKLPGQTLSSDGLEDCRIIANQIVDQWAARKAYAYTESFLELALTPNHQPHLIGPGLSSPDFDVAIRPVKIEQNGAALILNTQTPAVDVPLNLRDDDWWNNQRVKGIATNVPTSLYYSPDWPNGKLYLWPVPTFAYGLRLRVRNVLLQFASADAVFDAPPAYQAALVNTMAETLCEWWGLPVPPGLPLRAIKSRMAIGLNNIQSPRISSADHGTSGRKGGGFNYFTGQ